MAVKGKFLFFLGKGGFWNKKQKKKAMPMKKEPLSKTKPAKLFPKTKIFGKKTERKGSGSLKTLKSFFFKIVDFFF